MRKYLVKLAILIVILVNSLLFIGCYSEFRHPLANVAEAQPDEKLLGVWYDKSKVGISYLQFEKGENGLTKITIMENKTHKGLQTDDTSYLMFPTKIGSSSYMNIQEVKNAQISKNYMLVRYQLTTDNRLSLWLIDDKKVVKAIESGKLRGDIKNSDLASKAEVTDEGDSLKEFVQTLDNSSYEYLGSFQRLQSE